MPTGPTSPSRPAPRLRVRLDQQEPKSLVRRVVDDVSVQFLGRLRDRSSEIRVFDNKSVDVSVVVVGLHLLKCCLGVLPDHDKC